MEKQDIINGLVEIVGKDWVFTDENVILASSKDYIGFRVYQRADGKNFVPQATCVVKPQNVAEVSKVLNF